MTGLELLGLAATTAIAGVSAVASGQQQAAVARANSQIANQQAEAARAAGVAQENRVRNEADRVRASMRAAAGESGFVESGSITDLMDDSMVEAELDAMTVRRQAQAQAQSLDYEAQLQKWQGRQARTQGLVGLGAAVAQGAWRGFDRGLLSNPFGGGGGTSWGSYTHTPVVGMSGRVVGGL